jgi:hypothetical protein
MKTTLRKLEKIKNSHLTLFFDEKKLLNYLNKTEADDEELSLLTILESNGLDGALFALIAVDGFEKEIRLMACDFAESVVHLAQDERSVNAIKVARNYANGLATKEELNAARTAAQEANWAASTAANHRWSPALPASAAALDATGLEKSSTRATATMARGAARCVTFSPPGSANWLAASKAEKEKQIKIFKKYLK